MSITAIRNGVFSLLSTCGTWAASEISACAFDVLELTTGCVITFFPEGTTEREPFTMGGPRDKLTHYRIGGTLWLRDNGDPQYLLGRIWQGYDDLTATFDKDDTLQGSACAAMLVSITHQIDNFRLAGGHLWKPVDWVVVADEF